MPALITHYLCGNEMLKLIEDDKIKDIISKHRNVFNLGTQGPDIFFYYGAWPWKKSKNVPELGSMLHEEKTGEFISEALKYAAGACEFSKNIITAYMCGYLCHYSLDCHTHPYIFYRTGFVLEGQKCTKKYTCYHRMFETTLDVLMLKHMSGKRPAEINPSKYIKVSRNDAKIIGKMYEAVLKKVYGIGLSIDTICNAIYDMTGITAALRDRYGLKKKLLSLYEKKQGKLPLMSSMILPQEIKDSRDYLNISHSAWNLPWDDSVLLTSSFIEMFEAAALQAKNMCISIVDCIFQKSEIKQALLLIGSRSFSTGEDCNSDIRFRHFKCIYDE